MKLKNLIIGVCIGATPVAQGQIDVTNSSSSGFLSRGVLMYKNKNYVGAIDQLSHIKSMPATADMREESDFYIAMSKFNSGNTQDIETLKAFIYNYPSSFHLSEIWFNIGNSYFFGEKYGEAITSYNKSDISNLDREQTEDLLYRKGYSELRLANYELAQSDFNRISGSKKYREAVIFYQGYIDYVNNDHDQALMKFDRVNSNSELGDKAKYYMSQIYFTKNDYSKVIALGELLLKKKPKCEFYGEVNRIVGESYYQLGNDRDAQLYLETYVEEGTKEGFVMRSSSYILGVISYRQANYSKALSHLVQVTEENDALAQNAYLYVGQLYLKESNLNAASIAFEKAYTMNYDKDVQETAFYNYAIVQNEGGRTPFNKAIDVFEQFLNKYPNSKYAGNVEDYMINAYMKGNDYKRALESISRINKPSTKVLKAKQVVLYNLGVEALSNENVNQAHSLFQQAIGLGNNDTAIVNECKLWLGECLYRKGNYADATKNFKEFLNNIKADNKNYSLGNYNLGYSLFQQRNYSSAGQSFEKAVAKGSALNSELQADAYNRIGDSYYYSKQYTAAETAYDKAYSVNESIGDYALFQKGIMNGLQKQHNEKIKMLDMLLKNYSSSYLAPNAMMEKAQAQIALDKNKDAATTLESLLVKYPESSDARKGLLQLAITEKNIGNESKAVTIYKKVISQYPSSDEAVLATEDLKVIYADNNNMGALTDFLDSTPNAPKIDVSEIDKLTYYAAEKAYMAEKQDASKMIAYINKFPKGAYIVNAKFYIAKYNFQNGKFDTALKELETVLERGGDAAFAEDAIAMKSAILMKNGKATDALISYKELAKKATTPDNRINAHLGIMRSANELARYTEVIESANALIKLGGLTAEEEKEVLYTRAISYSNQNRGDDALKDWIKLSKDTRNIYGAQSAFRLAEYYFNSGNSKAAEKALNKFIDDGTPHHYWLARGFILLSDIYKKKGNSFEAREYLESLKSNYPGNDAEIFNMIDERLKSLKK